MRTTLDIDADVLQAAKELAEREGRTAGQMVSELARRGLTASAERTPRSGRLRNGVPVFPGRGEIVTIEHVQRLLDDEGA